MKTANLTHYLDTIMNQLPMLLTRITQTPGQCGGRPCIRGMRIRVSDILEMLAEGAIAFEVAIVLSFCSRLT